MMGEDLTCRCYLTSQSIVSSLCNDDSRIHLVFMYATPIVGQRALTQIIYCYTYVDLIGCLRDSSVSSHIADMSDRLGVKSCNGLAANDGKKVRYTVLVATVSFLSCIYRRDTKSFRITKFEKR